jgi:hypothetical protein
VPCAIASHAARCDPKIARSRISAFNGFRPSADNESKDSRFGLTPIQPLDPLEFVLCAVAGAVALSVAATYEPAFGHDGQATLVFFFTVPVGAVLGVVTASCISEHRRGDLRAAHLVAVLGGVGAGILSMMTGLTVATIYASGLTLWGATWWLGRGRRG